MPSNEGKSDKLDDSFYAAHADGALSPRSLQVLTSVDLGAQIQAGLGVAVDDVAASEVLLLVTIMPDDSGSTAQAGNCEVVREGQNLVLEALRASKQRDGILVHTRFLNGQVLFSYRPIDQTVPMTAANYDPGQATPLYDQAVVVLGGVLAKAEEDDFADDRWIDRAAGRAPK